MFSDTADGLFTSVMSVNVEKKYFSIIISWETHKIKNFSSKSRLFDLICKYT